MDKLNLVHGSKPNDPDPDEAEKDLCQLVSVIRLMVDKPNLIEVDFVKTDRTIVMKMKVGKADFGKVIGKQGKTINSIRTLINNISAKHGVRTVFDLEE
jgi:predicted RNA-binding protein YlqC (UPF0109 family)